jgi:hypothetical protein
MAIEPSDTESYLPYALLWDEIRQHIEEYHKEKFGDDPLYPIAAYEVWTKIEVILKWHKIYKEYFEPKLEDFLLSPERPDYPWEGPFQLWTDPGSRMNLIGKIGNRWNLFGRKDYPSKVCFDYTGMVFYPLGDLGLDLINDWNQEWKSSICGFESPLPRIGFDHWIRLTPRGWASEDEIYVDLHPFRDRTWFLLHIYGRNFWVKPD